MQTQQTIELFVEHSRQGTYFTVPFTMPPGVEVFRLSYHYQRHSESQSTAGAGSFLARDEINIIDLGLVSPSGAQVGASGSDKTEISLSETVATPGYTPTPLDPGTWQILVGAYKVAAEGVTVTYELTFTHKSMRLLKGDLHTHTLASDGVLTVEELGWRAKRHGLDFLAITDHNQMVSASSLPQIPGLTLIPGMEWTHYQGHASFLGVDKPYDTPFAANSIEEILERFTCAQERGALITVNHPFEPGCEFHLDMNRIPYDCLEVWNGPMRESNLRAVGLWQNLLTAGKKIPICGGSDYHRDTPFIFPGGPTTWIYAMSSGPGDILAALREGHSFITYAPDGPTLQLTAGDTILGGAAAWTEVREVQIDINHLLAGDIVRIVTNTGSDVLLEAPNPGRFRASYPMAAPGFARIEILRSFLPGIPPLPALLSNPVYFEG